MRTATRALVFALAVFGVFIAITAVTPSPWWWIPLLVGVLLTLMILSVLLMSSPEYTTNMLPPECADDLRRLRVYLVSKDGHFAAYNLPQGWLVTNELPEDFWLPFPPNILIYDENDDLVAYTTGEFGKQRLIVVDD